MKIIRARIADDRSGSAVFRDIGRVFDSKSGPMLKLDLIPIGWDGFAFLRDPLEKKETE